MMKLEVFEAYLMLGSNLGERELILAKALEQIEEKIGDIFIRSAIYETEAWGKTDQPSFLNIAIGITTGKDALALLHNLLEIEQSLGRVRHEKWGERLIDIDILLYGDAIINLGTKLVIPHPEMQHRKFVMQPLTEIAPNLIHPILKKPMSQIFSNLNDSLAVEKK